MKAPTVATKFKGILTKDNHQKVYKLCSVSIEEGTMTLSILDTPMQPEQQN